MFLIKSDLILNCKFLAWFYLLFQDDCSLHFMIFSLPREFQKLFAAAHGFDI